MPAGSEGVWVVRDPGGSVLGCSFRAPKCALEDAFLHVGSTSRARMEPLRKKVATDISSDHYEHGGYTLQRLPLATPEMVADAERMDWLQSQGKKAYAPRFNDNGDYIGFGDVRYRYWEVKASEGDSVRDAIDAARAAGGKDG